MTDDESYATFQQKVARHRHTLERYHAHLRKARQNLLDLRGA